MLPIEFTVPGPPVSYQTNVRSRLRAWEAKVRNAARACVPLGAPPVGRSGLMLTLVYYHEQPTVRIDNDNLLKPVQDALNGVIYTDDVLITHTVVRKENLDGSIHADDLSPALAAALVAGYEFIYVRVEFTSARGHRS
jgi:crossover junction endodeoxyribonuclease RusA